VATAIARREEDASVTKNQQSRNVAQHQSEREIYRSRAQLAAQYASLIQSLDETNQWALITGKALEAGLKKEELCRELSCAWSTILRWKAGDSSPGPFSRRAIKATLLRMIADLEKSEIRRATEAV
jgi:hypothetical protein